MGSRESSSQRSQRSATPSPCDHAEQPQAPPPRFRPPSQPPLPPGFLANGVALRDSQSPNNEFQYDYQL